MNPIALRLHEAALTLDGGNMPEIVAMLEIAEREITRLEETHIDPKSRVSWKIVAQEYISRCDTLCQRIDEISQPSGVLKTIDILIRRYQAWRWRKKFQPCVTIDYGGQATDRPMVHVGAYGNGGTQGVYSWPLDDQGNACASLYGRGLAEIFDVPLIDRRDPAWPRTK